MSAVQASNQIRRTIVGLKLHPYFTNLALVLQEGGNIHAVDVSNGMIVNDFLAMVQVNSSWAIDPYNYFVMVVGDQGKAILFDARMGAQSKLKKFKTHTAFGAPIVDEKMQKHGKRVPTYTAEIDSMTGEKKKWRVVKNFFTAHKFSRSEPHFVNTVKFSKQSSMFISSTNFGEVKLWDNKSCILLGTLNSHDFNPKQVLNYISRS